MVSEGAADKDLTAPEPESESDDEAQDDEVDDETDTTE